MFPLRDVSRQPGHFPIATVSIIVLNFLIFLLELSFGDAFVTRWSMIPADIVAGKHLETIITAIFLHGGWVHILGNMLFLWVFGPDIEDAMGPGRYTVFYLIGGLIANLTQLIGDPTSTVPNLGASGAIAAVMGAFLISYPRDRIRTLLFIGIFFTITRIPAVILIGFWFLLQIFNAVGSVADTQTGGVAYLAHIGGLIFGVVFARLFERRLSSETYDLPS